MFTIFGLTEFSDNPYYTFVVSVKKTHYCIEVLINNALSLICITSYTFEVHLESTFTCKTKLQNKALLKL